MSSNDDLKKYIKSLNHFGNLYSKSKLNATMRQIQQSMRLQQPYREAISELKRSGFASPTSLLSMGALDMSGFRPKSVFLQQWNDITRAAERETFSDSLTRSLSDMVKPYCDWLEGGKSYSAVQELLRGTTGTTGSSNSAFASIIKPDYYSGAVQTTNSTINSLNSFNSVGAVINGLGNQTARAALMSGETSAVSVARAAKLASGSSQFTGVTTAIDTFRKQISIQTKGLDNSWLFGKNNWDVKSSVFKSLDLGNMGAVSSDSAFAKLLKQEKRTADLSAKIAESAQGGLRGAKIAGASITSASAQIASIVGSVENRSDFAKNLIAPVGLLDGYANLAIGQHRGIQEGLEDAEGGVASRASHTDKSVKKTQVGPGARKDSEEQPSDDIAPSAVSSNPVADSEWHADALAVTSKFVDRQVKWNGEIVDKYEPLLNIEEDQSTLDIIDTVNEYNTDDYSVDQTEVSCLIRSIPQLIAYSKRNGSKISLVEAFEKSDLVRITELGKKLVENVGVLNDIAEKQGCEDPIKVTNELFTSMFYIGNTICSDREHFEKMVNALYKTFYENLEHIKDFIGNGNNKVGDNLVRKDDVYQCLFRLKALRTSFDHNVNKGSQSDILKQGKGIGDVYKLYCHKTLAQKAVDFRKMQIGLYADILTLEDHLIEIACNYATNQISK